MILIDAWMHSLFLYILLAWVQHAGYGITSVDQELVDTFYHSVAA